MISARTPWQALMGALLVVLLLPAGRAAGQAHVSEATQTCLECHAATHPGLVADWQRSRHARTTPGAALAVKGLGRKVSNPEIPGPLRGNSVGCAECHTLRTAAHQDAFEHNGFTVNVVVSPKDCATCHLEEEQQYGRNLMACAYTNLKDNPVFQLLEQSISGSLSFGAGQLTPAPANALTQADSCYYCHGTRLTVTGSATRDTDQGEMSFPVIAGWPNQGTGRINPDGSRGACSACHARHAFSMAMARKPYTCKECHVGPDVPAFKVYEASKHGNIFSSQGTDWDFTPVPWTVGRDFTAPTCAACHISLVVNPEGTVVAPRTHEVKNRLADRLFGLIYAHPHPKEPDTTQIRNSDGLPLPTDFAGRPAEAFLWDAAQQARAREGMQATCRACHAGAWVEGHWAGLANTIAETNAAVATATQIMAAVWAEGLASGLAAKASPFDEYIERAWAESWLFYANSIRFASAMAGGGDYGVFAGGRHDLSQRIRYLTDWRRMRRKTP